MTVQAPTLILTLDTKSTNLLAEYSGIHSGGPAFDYDSAWNKLNGQRKQPKRSVTLVPLTSATRCYFLCG